MGKYPKPSTPGDYEDSFLRIIANELAELNRLKRIEISMNTVTNKPEITEAQVLHLKSELEDQA